LKSVNGSNFGEAKSNINSNTCLPIKSNPCPEGWHVATLNEWDSSMEFLKSMLYFTNN
jgi:hypothetical protein